MGPMTTRSRSKGTASDSRMDDGGDRVVTSCRWPRCLREAVCPASTPMISRPRCISVAVDALLVLRGPGRCFVAGRVRRVRAPRDAWVPDGARRRDVVSHVVGRGLAAGALVDGPRRLSRPGRRRRRCTEPARRGDDGPGGRGARRRDAGPAPTLAGRSRHPAGRWRGTSRHRSRHLRGARICYGASARSHHRSKCCPVQGDARACGARAPSATSATAPHAPRAGRRREGSAPPRSSPAAGPPARDSALGPTLAHGRDWHVRQRGELWG